MILKTSPYSFFRLSIIVGICALWFGAKAEIVGQPEAEHKEKELKHAGNSADSIKILLDVYDLSDKLNRDRIRLKIMDVAQRTDNNQVLTQAINELASSTDDAGQLSRLIEISQNIPDGDDKKSVETVLQMEQAKVEMKNTGENDLQKRIMEYAKTGMSVTGDPYQEIQNIYRALVFLGSSSMGPMYLEYITRLGDLVKNLPEKDHAIKNLYYTMAALFYTRKRDFKEAIECDRELIKQLKAMEATVKANGKEEEDLGYFYYVSYRRMLRNFRGLTPEEIEEAFSKCQQLAAENERVKEEFAGGGLTHSYYYMATGQYAQAVPYLRKALAKTDISKFRRMELTGLLAWALRETGDAKGELEALRDFTTMSINDQLERRKDTYREIDLRNNVTKILADEYKQQELQKEENVRMRKTSLTLVYVLAIILIFVFRAYFNLRQKVKLLESGNKKLRTNIEQIIDDGSPRGTLNLRNKKQKLKG